MATRAKKSLSAGWIIILLLVVFGAAGAVTYYVTKGPQVGMNPDTKPTARPWARTKPAGDALNVTIYLPHLSQTSRGEFYLVPVSRKAAAKGDSMEVALQTLLATSGEGGETGKLIPQGTKLLSPVTVKDGLATVNLSKEFTGNFAGSSTDESLTLNSIVHTLVYNSGGRVRQVQILVEGKTADSLGGAFDLTRPIAPDDAMLRPGSKD